MEMRSLIGLLMLYPLIHGRRLCHPDLAPLATCRAQHGHGAVRLVLALTLIPLAQVISIEFTMPIWWQSTVASSANAELWKNLAVVLGVVGVVIIVRRHQRDARPAITLAAASASPSPSPWSNR
jgi:threonine/homoserine efflux transporter RhtA